MKTEERFFIMKLWQTGNIGSHNIAKLDANPKNGFENATLARKKLEALYEEGDWEVKEGDFEFTILPIFSFRKK